MCVFLCTCVCIHVYVYMYLCVFICTYIVCACVCMCKCVYICIHICMYVYICMYACMYICICIQMYIQGQISFQVFDLICTSFAILALFSQHIYFTKVERCKMCVVIVKKNDFISFHIIVLNLIANYYISLLAGMCLFKDQFVI